MPPTSPEFRPRTDSELVALTDTRYHGAVTISMALELIEARKRIDDLESDIRSLHQ